MLHARTHKLKKVALLLIRILCLNMFTDFKSIHQIFHSLSVPLIFASTIFRLIGHAIWHLLKWRVLRTRQSTNCTRDIALAAAEWLFVRPNFLLCHCLFFVLRVNYFQYQIVNAKVIVTKKI